MTTLQKASAKGPDGAARLLRYLAMPIFLGLAGLALYLYAGTLIQQTARLIELAAVSTAIVVTLAVITGILLTRPFARRVSPFVIGLANIGQAVPSIGVLALLAIIWSIGFWPCIVALVAYSFLSILRNTMVGLRQDHRSTI